MCGISACVDDRYSSIRCLNSGGVASEALPTITENTATLLSEVQRQDDDDRDLFEDLTTTSLIETNELLGLVDNTAVPVPVIPDCSLIT